MIKLRKIYEESAILWISEEMHVVCLDHALA